MVILCFDSTLLKYLQFGILISKIQTYDRFSVLFNANHYEKLGNTFGDSLR